MEQAEKKRRGLFFVAAAFLVLGLVNNAAPGLAAERTVELDVKMTCPTSNPPAIKHFLGRAPGVTSVSVAYAKQKVTVRYDDTLTHPAALRQILGQIGFTASPD